MTPSFAMEELVRGTKTIFNYMRENLAMWKATMNTCHDLWTCKDLERDVKICLKQRVALIGAQHVHQMAKSQSVSLQQSNELTI